MSIKDQQILLIRDILKLNDAEVLAKLHSDVSGKISEQKSRTISQEELEKTIKLAESDLVNKNYSSANHLLAKYS